MIKEINKDKFFLSQKSEDMMPDDAYMIKDLEDTFESVRERCVGMAANMIGYRKNMIIAAVDGKVLVMLNPVIEKFIGKKMNVTEGCLSLEGIRETARYEKIKVSYYDKDFKKRIKTFQGFEAQIIQHEIDHCNGVLI